MLITFTAVAAVFVLLIAERTLLYYARKRFSLVIHVNGTRGKSTVTRMIHALLRQQGMEVYGKTTGSAARFLLPDGTERPVRRFGPANVREQRNMMLLGAMSAKSQKAALVFESNVINEELQHISSRWLMPDVTIITNVREDHVLELGKAEQAAEIFASAVPGNSILVTSEKNFIAVWEAAAKQKSLKLMFVSPNEAEDAEFPENAACVLGVADHLGIDRSQALQAAIGHKPDIGAFAVYSWESGAVGEASRSIFFADARAANDIESTDRLLSSAFSTIELKTPAMRILLLVNREDRPDRSRDFLQYIVSRHKEASFDRYLCIGHAPLSFKRTIKAEGVHCRFIKHIKDLENELVKAGTQAVFVFAVGNFGGKGQLLSRWLEAKRQAVQ